MNEPEHDTARDGPEEPCRRTVLEGALKAAVATWVAGIGTPAVVYLWPARRAGPGNATLKAGSAQDLEIGKSMLAKAEGRPILVVRVAEDDYRAFSAICTHLGCLVDWKKDQKQMVCPCHGGCFDVEGKVVAGPPPVPLPRYPVSIEAGQILVRLKSE